MHAHLGSRSIPVGVRAFQLAGVAIVATVVAGWLPVPKSLTQEMPQQARWLAALAGLLLGVGFLWLDRRFEFGAIWARSSAIGRVVCVVSRPSPSTG